MKAVLLSAVAAALFFSPAAITSGGQSRQGHPNNVRPVHGGFEVEVLVGGWPLEKLFGRGRSYVEATEGAEYELRIRNPLPYRVAVALSVDGLNTIDARRTSSWDASKWVIEPYGTLRVGGWQMSSSRSRRFYFTSERDSYAARLGRPGDLGVITAVFYRESTPAVIQGRTRPYPAEEQGRRADGDARAQGSAAPRVAEKKERGDGNMVADGVVRGEEDYAATGIGRPVENQVYRVEMSLERRPAAEVTIRYEYRPALARLGILPRPRPYGDDPLRRRERARGFNDPEFCPEP